MPWDSAFECGGQIPCEDSAVASLNRARTPHATAHARRRSCAGGFLQAAMIDGFRAEVVANLDLDAVDAPTLFGFEEHALLPLQIAVIDRRHLPRIARAVKRGRGIRVEPRFHNRLQPA